MSTTDMTARNTTTRWRLDPAHSTAEFSVPHLWGLVKVKGKFDRLDGWLETDRSGHVSLELTVDAASLSTGNRQRDRHLRGADFFDAGQHPELRFQSTTGRDRGNGRLHVEGELVGAGHRVALELEPTLKQTSDRLQIDAIAAIDQRQLGMTWSPLGMARTPVTVTVHAQLRPER
jgi:polyisoprenoid-binding protein YceI